MLSEKELKEAFFSSKSEDWATPQAFFDGIAQYIPFTLDVCATAENAKCKAYYTKSDNALSKHWKGVCWMNPPYGRGVGAWVEKARVESDRWNSTVVCLLPSRTDVGWFHDIILPFASYLKFIRGRLKFGNSKNSAPFPSLLCAFGPLGNMDLINLVVDGRIR